MERPGSWIRNRSLADRHSRYRRQLFFLQLLSFITILKGNNCETLVDLHSPLTGREVQIPLRHICGYYTKLAGLAVSAWRFRLLHTL